MSPWQIRYNSFFLITSKIDTYFYKKLQLKAPFDRITAITGKVSRFLQEP